MRNIRAGALRTPVVLGQPVIAKDTTGGEVITWTEFDSWAFIEPLSGREWATSGAVKDAIDCRITIRLVAGATPSARWRVRDPQTGRVYNVVTAMVIDKAGAVECLAKTDGNADGR